MHKHKMVFLVLALVMLIGTSVPASAVWHEGDDFTYGVKFSFATQAQWSKFYCPEQYHHATAVIVDKGGNRHEDKDYAEAGYTASAQTGYYSASEWNSYYGHD